MRAGIPLLGSTEKERFNCVYGKADPPCFTLTFPDGSLPVDRIDPGRPWMVVVDFPDQTLAVSARFVRVVDPLTLELAVQETVSHAQSRGFFRVDASTKVLASSTVPEEWAEVGEHWKLLGDTIDLSGSGLLCSFSEPLENGKQVNIELSLPTQPMGIIKALGHVVRCRKVEEHLFHVALQFDWIDSESQDKIMACCFELQRRHLRMRVRLENQRTG